MIIALIIEGSQIGGMNLASKFREHASSGSAGNESTLYENMIKHQNKLRFQARARLFARKHRLDIKYGHLPLPVPPLPLTQMASTEEGYISALNELMMFHAQETFKQSGPGSRIILNSEGGIKLKRDGSPVFLSIYDMLKNISKSLSDDEDEQQFRHYLRLVMERTKSRAVRRWMRAFDNSETGVKYWDRWCVPICYLCGERLGDFYTDVDVDHIKPKSGFADLKQADETSNLALTHRHCNNTKKDASVHEEFWRKREGEGEGKDNCSSCQKLVPVNRLDYCTPPYIYRYHMRIGDAFIRYCDDCRLQFGDVCVCETPEQHVRGRYPR